MFSRLDVEAMPKQLEPGVLYVSERFSTAAHLCACGCGEKIRTPLGPTEWTVTSGSTGPSLRPSIGNWQKPCRSHYWILQGEVHWSGDWSEDQVLAGRASEAQRREKYHRQIQRERRWSVRIWNWIKSLCGF